MKASHPATCDESHAYRLKGVELGRGVALDVSHIIYLQGGAVKK